MESLTSERITEIREQLGWSKARLAREAGMHPSTISNIERGRMVPYPSQLEKIGGAFERAQGATV